MATRGQAEVVIEDVMSYASFSKMEKALLAQFQAEYEAIMGQQEKEPEWCPGEWREYKLDKGLLLKRCTGYWNPKDGYIGKKYINVQPIGEINSRTRSYPVFERWWVVDEGTEKYLYSGYRIRGSSSKDEGYPFGRLYCVTGMGYLQIEGMIEDGSFTNWHRYNSRPKNSIPRERTPLKTLWKVEYNGHSVLEISLKHPKMSFSEIENVIKNEGGYVDKEGIVRK